MSICDKKYLKTQFGGDYVAADRFIKEEIERLYKDVPKHPPMKPTISEHTAKGAKAYAAELEVYESQFNAYNVLKDAAYKRANEYKLALVEYIEYVVGIDTIVPEQYRDKVKAKAWEDGHSGGYVEYANELIDLAHIFE